MKIRPNPLPDSVALRPDIQFVLPEGGGMPRRRDGDVGEFVLRYETDDLQWDVFPVQERMERDKVTFEPQPVEPIDASGPSAAKRVSNSPSTSGNRIARTSSTIAANEYGVAVRSG